MTPRAEAWIWIAHRATAAYLAAAVVVHLATIVYAVDGGLSAAEILGRTRGNGAWLAFYAMFAASAAVHGSAGLRTVIREHTGWRGGSLDLAALGLAAVLTVLGWRAVGGLFA